MLSQYFLFKPKTKLYGKFERKDYRERNIPFSTERVKSVDKKSGHISRNDQKLVMKYPYCPDKITRWYNQSCQGRPQDFVQGGGQEFLGTKMLTKFRNRKA